LFWNIRELNALWRHAVVVKPLSVKNLLYTGPSYYMAGWLFKYKPSWYYMQPTTSVTSAFHPSGVDNHIPTCVAGFKTCCVHLCGGW